VIYDKHYTDEEIKGLLQFYGSPLGQKAAAEMPKISKEIQLADRTLSAQAAAKPGRNFIHRIPAPRRTVLSPDAAAGSRAESEQFGSAGPGRFPAAVIPREASRFSFCLGEPFLDFQSMPNVPF